jgi:hypothetical protein
VLLLLLINIVEVRELWGSRSSVTVDTHFWDVAPSCSIPFVLEIGPFHLQLFLNSHVHFCVTVVLVIFQVLVHCPKRSSSTCAAFTSFLLLGHLVQYSSWMSIWPCSDCLHHFLTCGTVIMLSPTVPLYHLILNLDGGKHGLRIKSESHCVLLRWAKFPVLLPLHICLSQ